MMQRPQGLVLAISAVIAIFAVGRAPAATIHGVCEPLDALGGQIYIPLKNATSGRLTTDGTVGTTQDTVLLGYNGSLMVGKASFIWKFDLSEYMTAGETVDPDSLLLNITFDDFDFTQSLSPGFSYRETLALTFLCNCTDRTGMVPDLLVNHNNYGNYRVDGFGPTDDTAVTYTFSLGRDLGVTADDLANVASDCEFGIFAVVSGRVTHTRLGSETFTQSNRDSVDLNNVNVAFAPEPASLAILAVGSLLLVRPRKR